MSHKTLVVDDTVKIREMVRDTLECLGHNFDEAGSIEEAQSLLDENTYDCILLDLGLPVRFGRSARVQNGINLFETIRKDLNHRDAIVIIMTGHGNEGPELATKVLRGSKGADDFISKPFPSTGRTLDVAIKEAFDARKESPAKISLKKEGAHSKKEPQSFTKGEVTFYQDRVEVLGVRCCAEVDGTLGRRIMDQLNHVLPNGKHRAMGGKELAEVLEVDGGQNSISGAVRELRNTITKNVLKARNIKVGLKDIIQSGSVGFRFSSKIKLRTVVEKENKKKRSAFPGVVSSVALNDRQKWVLNELQNGREAIRRKEVEEQFEISTSTAKRLLGEMVNMNFIEYVGSQRSGWYRLKG